jgi:hypothetical protein
VNESRCVRGVHANSHGSPDDFGRCRYGNQ